tara:strand:- start:154 stop:477 length:324 start_codon:yes stop_codon:yes gene_type:complete
MSDPVTITTALGIACAAVAALWKALHTQSEKVETRLSAKLDECEAKHEEVNGKLLVMSSDLGELRGQMTGHQQAREDLGELGSLSAACIHWMRETVQANQSKGPPVE